ncbi:Ig-like domain-containing protein [Maribacter luteus]|uniref:Ig-like domain-containing protein n=1 Tax=Maribacter luteus TaxID=2594478 RepID=UPI0024905C14|nr:Ig-like domain-containing protein [Maribacter luteus]
MKFKTLAPLKVFLLSIFIISQLSCSKDSDLLTDFVLSETQNTLDLSELILDDTFIVNSRESITLDVLANDGFENIESVIITETSEPENGTVVINTDNTLTYTPDTATETTPEEPIDTTPNSNEEIEDTFTYTTEVINEDDTVSTGTGNVTVTSENKAPITGDNVYYVSTTGKANNDGRSEATAWNIQHAFATAVAGDVVYVKAGNYGAIKVASSKSGADGNPIKFIGYSKTPGDILATNGPTFSKDQWQANGQSFDSSVMPMLDWNPTNFKPVSGDDGISIKHDFIEIHNFIVQEYMIGIDVWADNVVINNCYSDRAGDWDPNGNCYNGASKLSCTNNNGYGIRFFTADHGTLKNSMVIDAGMISVYILNVDDMLVENSESYTVNTGNATDYMFEFSSTTNSIIRNCYAERTHTLLSAHTSRLFAIKCSTNNIIENFRGSRSKIQVQNSSNNNFKNISISGQYAEFQVNGKSDSNTIENLEISGGYGISFLGWAGAECGYPLGSSIPAGDNNYFINPKIHDSENGLQGTAIVSFHRLNGNVTASAGTNYIIGGSFYNFPRILSVNRTGTITFSDCTFNNIYKELDGYYNGFPDETENYTANFINCSFSGNAFANPIGN